jgi:3-deoxy-manno-octulosonate cytidylyltransferase (CMP-KDO synthetase)
MANNNAKIIVVIPARYASTRFPGKPLADIYGKPMIIRVYEQARKSIADEVIVATDSIEIFDAVQKAGKMVMMTSTAHSSGTERCGEIAEKLLANKTITPSDFIINVQGDEPFIDAEQINSLAKTLNNSQINIATLVKYIDNVDNMSDANIVKAVFDNQNSVLYFSRAPIPYYRNRAASDKMGFWKHIGIYGYKVDTLLEIIKLPETSLEKIEVLEQLRWLENGYKILACQTDIDSYSIDIPEDINKIPDEIIRKFTTK